ncbi:MAG: hypothetical protein NWE92_11675 [Candidatus Bathyarchaeota archaeon]|nr:hypothetical protein [Candidatus Bathyarchaeota archaeon]
MKKPVKIILALALLATFCLISVAAASTPDPHFYSVDKTSPVDPVKLGDSVVITATTDNPKVNRVEFKWWAPGSPLDGLADYSEVDITPADGFTSSHIVNKPGEWTMTANFTNVQASGEYKYIWSGDAVWTVTKDGNFFVVAEYPLIGAAGASIAMMFGLLVFKRKEIVNQL